MARNATSARIRIVTAPPGTTIQDGGRNGWLHAAVPPSGPLDPAAHAAANLAVGNDARAAALEVPLGSLRIMAGAAVRVSVDGAALVTLAADEELVVPACARAVRYLAASGAFAVEPVLGSCATLLSAGWGGFHGRAVRVGDELPIGPARPNTAPAPAVPSVVDPPDPAVLHVRPGPHVESPSEAAARGRGRAIPGSERLSAELIEQLCSSVWRVSPRSDRVGVRLEGPALRRDGDDRAPPAPMIRGAVQITTDGTPIVLGPDHPVTGGYPVVAVLGRSSQAVLARLRPNRAVRFVMDGGSSVARSGSQ